MAIAAEGTNLAFHILNPVDTPRGAVALVTGMAPQITNCDPSSTTRFDGILKKAVALLALRNMATNSNSRQYAISDSSFGISVSRPRKRRGWPSSPARPW